MKKHAILNHADEVEEVPVEVVEEQQVQEPGDEAVEPEVEPDADAVEADEADTGEEPLEPVSEQADEDQEPPCKVEMEQPCADLNIDDESTLSIDGGVVEKIVAMTCREVDGVLQLKGSLINSLPGLRGSDATKGVSVEMSGDDACTVNVAVILEYGKSAPRVFQELHDKVVAAIEGMTGLKVNAVNVRVTNVLTRAQAESGKRKDKADA